MQAITQYRIISVGKDSTNFTKSQSKLGNYRTALFVYTGSHFDLTLTQYSICISWICLTAFKKKQQKQTDLKGCSLKPDFYL